MKQFYLTLPLTIGYWSLLYFVAFDVDTDTMVGFIIMGIILILGTAKDFKDLK